MIAQALKERSEEVYVVTKAGRRLNPHVAEGYNQKNLNAFVERSLKNLGVKTIDLVQLHCPPTDVYYMPEVFGILDDLVQAGKIRYYGVSVEKVEGDGVKICTCSGSRCNSRRANLRKACMSARVQPGWAAIR